MLSTWTITHALFKATRQAIFMILMWPLKTDGATTFGPARSFRPFLLFGVLRILCFLVVPAAFVAEWLGWYSSP